MSYLANVLNTNGIYFKSLLGNVNNGALQVIIALMIKVNLMIVLHIPLQKMIKILQSITDITYLYPFTPERRLRFCQRQGLMVYNY